MVKSLLYKPIYNYLAELIKLGLNYVTSGNVAEIPSSSFSLKLTTIVSSSKLVLTRKLKTGRITENLSQSDEVEQEMKILVVTSEPNIGFVITMFILSHKKLLNKTSFADIVTCHAYFLAYALMFVGLLLSKVLSCSIEFSTPKMLLIEHQCQQLPR